MSDFVLSVVPADMEWQPDADTGRAAADLVASMALAPGDGGWHEVKWHDEVVLVDCGENLERIGCPHCGSEVDAEWWRDLVEQRFTAGQTLADGLVAVPCCGVATALELLDYDWPMAFARFEIAVWNPSKPFQPGDGQLTADQVGAVQRVLGCPIRQVRAHY